MHSVMQVGKVFGWNMSLVLERDKWEAGSLLSLFVMVPHISVFHLRCQIGVTTGLLLRINEIEIWITNAFITAISSHLVENLDWETKPHTVVRERLWSWRISVSVKGAEQNEEGLL